jgi:hypothetical protein
MKRYHKIETVYARSDEGDKKLIPNVYRNPAVEYLKDSQWIFTEKIDGTNICVFWDGYKVSFGGRTDKAVIPPHLLEYLEKTFGGRANEELFEQRFGLHETVIYGEGCGPKIQLDGALYSSTVTFVLFDVLMGHTYLERKDMEEIALMFNTPIASVVLIGTIDEAFAYVKTRPLSVLAEKEKQSEGVIGIPKAGLLERSGKRIIVKIRVEDIEQVEEQEKL